MDPVEALLATARCASEENHVSVEDVRAATREFLAMLADEREHEGWNLVMNDGDVTADAMFVVIVVKELAIVYGAGTDDPCRIRMVSEHLEPLSDPLKVFEALSAQGLRALPDRVTVPRNA